MSEGVLDTHLGLLARLIAGSGWHAEPRAVSEAVPHLSAALSGEDYIAALRNLDLPVDIARGRLDRVKAADLPCLFVADDASEPAIILAARAGAVRLARAESPDGAWQPAFACAGTFVRIARQARTGTRRIPDDVASVAGQFRGTVAALLFASFVANAMGLFPPLLIMALYDRAIPSRATEFVLSLAVGMVAVFAADFALRAIRAQAVAHMGGAMEGRLGLALFRKLAAVPIEEIRKSDVDQQIARLKQFEGMRDLFAGPVFTALLDVPFILLFLGILFILSPAIGLLMLGALVAFAIAARLTGPVLSRRNAEAAAARTTQQKLYLETVQRQRDLIRLGLGPVWADRLDAAAEAAAETSRTARIAQMTAQALGQSIMGVAGIGAVALGTGLAMAGEMSLGALIAVTSLVWKTLAPVQALCASLPQMEALRRSQAQIDRVLALREEFTRRAGLSDFKSFAGRISLTGVSHRYPGAPDTALSQVSLEIAPGEYTVVAGPNGSGKTTLLDLIDGLYTPFAGALQLDGVNYRQIAVDDLRHMISTARHEAAFFHGTIRQNFRLACPDMSNAAITDAVAAMQLGESLAHLPDGLDTRLSEETRRRLATATLQGLSLARCLARPAAVYLLDDPDAGLDAERQAALDAWLEALRGRRTVVVASNRRAQILRADRLIYLDGGRLLVNDTGDAGRRKVMALLSRG